MKEYLGLRRPSLVNDALYLHLRVLTKGNTTKTGGVMLRFYYDGSGMRGCNGINRSCTYGFANKNYDSIDAAMVIK
jgi:hypothetical protein